MPSLPDTPKDRVLQFVEQALLADATHITVEKQDNKKYTVTWEIGGG